jgi:hypothetical protein
MFEKYAVLSKLFQGFVVGVLPVEIWALAEQKQQKAYLKDMANNYANLYGEKVRIDLRSVNFNDNLYFIARRSP